MKVERVLQRLVEGEFSMEVIRQVARDVGHELRHNDIEKLCEFRSAVARLMSRQEAAGRGRVYLEAVLDVVAAYESSVTPKLEEAEAVTIIKQKDWVRILARIGRYPVDRIDLAREIERSEQFVFEAVSFMVAANLIEGWPGSEGAKPKFLLTLRGETVARTLGIPEPLAPWRCAVES